MNRADRWLGDTTPMVAGNTTSYAGDTARRIADRPSTIVVSRRDPTTGATIQLAPQTVRIEVAQRGSDEQFDAMVSISHQYVVLIGYKDHPTIPNTNLLRADEFFFNGRMYEVVDFIDTVPGRLLASAELTP